MQSMQKIVETVGLHPTCSAPQKTMMNQQETMSSSSKDSSKTEKRIDLLFSRFAAFYGHIWRSQLKDEKFLKFAKTEWREGLNEFSDEVLTKAILSCREFYEFPPTLPQMIQCCRKLRKQMSFYVVKTHVPANKAVVTSCLQRCKELLAK